jgi:hypothetical protein
VQAIADRENRIEARGGLGAQISDNGSIFAGTINTQPN